MRRNLYAVVVILGCIFISNNSLFGQDIHFSQFYNSPLNINPALTGIFNGDKRIIGSFRDQDRQVKVPYTTFSGNYDMKVYTKNREKGFFGVGAIFNYDNAGTTSYSITDLNLTGSYSRILTPNHILTGGVLLGVASEGVDLNGIRWDAQWTGDRYDPNVDPGETFNQSRFTYLETGVGVNYRFQKSSRTNFNLGAGLWHLNTPSATYDNLTTSDLPMRLAFNFTGLFKVANPFDIQLHANYMTQDQYQTLVLGGLGRIHLNQKPGSQFAVDLGLSYRGLTENSTATLIPTAALHYNQWYVGASYDFNLDAFVGLHDTRSGGPEVHIMYTITDVKPLSEKKACPIF